MRIKYKKLKYIIFVLCILGSFLASSPAVRAADNTCITDNDRYCKTILCKDPPETNVICTEPDPALQKKCTNGDCDLVRRYVNPAIKLLSGLVGVVAVLSFIMTGIQFSSAGGDPQKVAAARGRIGKTIAALIIYAFLYAGLQFLVPGGVFNR